jgi:hypothetical protein
MTCRADPGYSIEVNALKTTFTHAEMPYIQAHHLLRHTVATVKLKTCNNSNN